MKKILKFQNSGSFPSLSGEFQTGANYNFSVPPVSLDMFNPPQSTLLQEYKTKSGAFANSSSSPAASNLSNQAASQIGSSVIGKFTDFAAKGIFGDGGDDFTRGMSQVFSSGLNSVGNTVFNNALKKETLTNGLKENALGSLKGVGIGLGSSLVGKGITSAMGNSKLGKFTGTAGSSALSQVLSGGGSPANIAMSAVGAGLSAAFGPSKEYQGKYGSITKGMDTAYDTIQGVASVIPGWGTAVAAGMALNKGLSNVFGSTSGMTKQDAILGSAFMPAPVKWLNMAGAKTTDTFKNQSWQNTEKTNAFMQNAFGNLGDKFDKAREEAGKTYGTFSRGAYKRAQAGVDFANTAWDQILDMTRQNEYQNIRAQEMSSINNQRYAQMIQGGFSPLARGKMGMKILNNSINHNLGQRFLSGAALIDNKQVILSKCREVD